MTENKIEFPIFFYDFDKKKCWKFFLSKIHHDQKNKFHKKSKLPRMLENPPDSEGEENGVDIAYSIVVTVTATILQFIHEAVGQQRTLFLNPSTYIIYAWIFFNIRTLKQEHHSTHMLFSRRF